MIRLPEKNIRTTEDVLQILDAFLPVKTDWEYFYSEGRFQPPFLRNLPDENLVSYFDTGALTAGNAVDLGCGPGRNAIYLAVQGCKVDGVDLSDTAITQARQRAEEAGVNVQFTVGSVFDITLTTDYYDIAYDSGLLHHLQPHRRPFYLQMVHRILKLSGLFGMVCFNDDMTPAVEDWIIYRDRKMPPGLGYSERRLVDILEPYFDILEFRPLKVVSPESGSLGYEGMWTVLMKPLKEI